MENYSDIHLEVQRYIEAHHSERIVLTDFVRDKNISQRQTQRALSWHDTTWQRMLLDERMKRAKTLLAHSTESIGRIAEMSATSIRSSAAHSEAEEGMGPEEYREWLVNEQT